MTGVELGNLEANQRFLRESGLLVPGVRVLEIGSGRGSMLKWLAEMGAEAQGIEVSAERIAEGREIHGPLPLQLTTGTALPFPDGSFDVVVSFDVLEHIPDTDAHLAEVRRVLREGGQYLLQTPNKWTNTVFETIRWRSLTAWRDIHCALHTAGELERRFRRFGFTVTFADVPVVTPFFLAKVRRHLGRPGVALLRVCNPDWLPLRWRTNFYVTARRAST